jgi:hypothetical protein
LRQRHLQQRQRRLDMQRQFLKVIEDRLIQRAVRPRLEHQPGAAGGHIDDFAQLAEPWRR